MHKENWQFEDLAQYSEMSLRTIMNFASGGQNISLGKLLKLAAAFGYNSLDEFLDAGEKVKEDPSPIKFTRRTSRAYIASAGRS